MCIFVAAAEKTVVLPQYSGHSLTFPVTFISLCSKIHKQFYLSRTYSSYLKLGQLLKTSLKDIFFFVV